MRPKPHTRILLCVVLAAVAAGAGCDKLRARDKLNKGVQAFKGGQYDAAIEDFKAAKGYDPALMNARLYLATAYSSQYIPGAPSQENINMGNQAIQEYQEVLSIDPSNLNAIDGIGSMLYNMGGTPFDPKKFEESKTYHEKHIALKPDDPDPYYWIGVIDWSLAFRGNKELRDEFNRSQTNPKKQVKETDPMPPKVAADFQQKYGSIVDEGMTNLNKAIEIRSDYDDAMAYLNLLLRQKADMESTVEARNADLQQADELVEKVKAIKQKRAEATPVT
jgi:tetratricopeptide (TPR) repeat protein